MSDKLSREEQNRQTFHAIRDWRKSNPGDKHGFKEKCSKDTNISRARVTRFWDLADPKNSLDENTLNFKKIPSFENKENAQTDELQENTVNSSASKTDEILKNNSVLAMMKAPQVGEALVQADPVKSAQTAQQQQVAKIEVQAEEKADETLGSAGGTEVKREEIKTVVNAASVSDPDDEEDPALKKAEAMALTAGVKPSDGAKPYVKKVESEAPTRKKSFFDRFKKIKKTKDAQDPKAETKKEKANRKLENPYLDQAHQYRDRYRELAMQNTWLKISICAAVLLLLGGLALQIEISNRSSFIPYVISVDTHGNAVGSGVATPVADHIENRVVRSALTGFINNMRTVTVDKIMLAEQQWNIYAMLEQQDPAYTKCVEWLTGEDPEVEGKSPFERAASEIVHVKFVSIVNLTPDSLQIEWIETSRDRRGQKKAPAKPMRAIVTWKKGTPPSELDGIQRNPYGIFIKDFSWTQIH